MERCGALRRIFVEAGEDVRAPDLTFSLFQDFHHA
jgi:hypothetical protein